jgi:hypothetical protein
MSEQLNKRSIDDLVKTMPWRSFAGPPGVPGNVQIIDANGQVVPLFDMLAWVEYSTQRAAELSKRAANAA